MHKLIVLGVEFFIEELTFMCMLLAISISQPYLKLIN